MKHLYLVLFSTFLFGLVVGGLFFLGTVGKEGGGGIEEPGSGYVIEAFMYGGCMRLGCPLYRIEQTGEYIYIASATAQGEGRKSGTVPLVERRAIGEELKDIHLEDEALPQFLGECPVNYDGIAYRYEITYKGERYRIDSCVQDTEGEILFHTLEGYFETFRLE